MNFSAPERLKHRPPPGAGTTHPSPASHPIAARVPRARFLICLVLAAGCFSAFSAQVRIYDTNPYTGNLDTNYYLATKISSNILSSGGVIGQGVPQRITKAADGMITNYFAAGWYSVSNKVLARGIVIEAPDDTGSTVYDYTNLLRSGFNTYVSQVNLTTGSGGGSITNDQVLPTTDGGQVTIDSAGDAKLVLQAPSGATVIELRNANQTNYISAGGGQDVVLARGGVSDTNRIWMHEDYTEFNKPVTLTGGASGNLTGNADTATTTTTAITATNVVGTFSPFAYGGSGSITVDDTLAISNMIVAINAAGSGRVDCGNRSWFVSQLLPPFNVSQLEVCNGGIFTSNKTMAWLLAVDQDQSTGVKRNYRFSNLTLGRMGYGDPPTMTSVGLRIGTNNLYGLNGVVQNCTITNFGRGVEITGVSQTWLDHNFISQNWSNNIFVGVSPYNPDGLKLTYNDINNNDILPCPDQILTNAILIQMEQGCLNFFEEGSNAGGGKKAFQARDTGNYKFLNSQWELFRSGNSSNLVLFTFTNSTVQMDGIGGLNGIYYANPYGSSNYLAMVGLYGFCNFDACYFKSPSASGGYSFDIWQRTPSGQPDGTTLPYMDSAYYVVSHATYGDAGVASGNFRGNIPKTTDPTTRWWSTNLSTFDGNVQFNNGSDLGLLMGGDVQAKGTYSGLNLVGEISARIVGGNYGTFIGYQSYNDNAGVGFYDGFLGGSPNVQRVAPTNWWIFTSETTNSTGVPRWRFSKSDLLPLRLTNSIGSAASPVGNVFATNFSGLSGSGTYLTRFGTNGTPTGGGDALVANPLSQFASTTSSQLRGVLSDESGTGVFLTANGDGSSLTSVNAATVTTTAGSGAGYVLMADATTGNQAVKTGFPYDAGTGAASITTVNVLNFNPTNTTFRGPINGDGNAATNFSAVSAGNFTNTSLTALRVVMTDSAKGQGSATASGTQILRANGTAVTVGAGLTDDGTTLNSSVGTLANYNLGFSGFDDLFSASQSATTINGPLSLVRGTATGTLTSVDPGETGAIGVARFTSGGTEGNFVSYAAAGFYLANNITITNAFRFRLITTNSVADGFGVRLGLMSSSGFANPATHGVYLAIRTNSTKIDLINIRSSTPNIVDTGVTWATNTWYNATVIVFGTNTVICSINSAAFVTNNTSIPTAGNALSMGAVVQKHAGATSGLADLDYIYLGYGLNPGR